jgi:hypothetical protein
MLRTPALIGVFFVALTVADFTIERLFPDVMLARTIADHIPVLQGTALEAGMADKDAGFADSLHPAVPTGGAAGPLTMDAWPAVGRHLEHEPVRSVEDRFELHDEVLLGHER